MSAKEVTVFLAILTTRLEYELTILNQALPAGEQAYANLGGLRALVAELQSAISMLESLSPSENREGPALHPIPTVGNWAAYRYN